MSICNVFMSSGKGEYWLVPCVTKTTIPCSCELVDYCSSCSWTKHGDETCGQPAKPAPTFLEWFSIVMQIKLKGKSLNGPFCNTISKLGFSLSQRYFIISTPFMKMRVLLPCFYFAVVFLLLKQTKTVTNVSNRWWQKFTMQKTRSFALWRHKKKKRNLKENWTHAFCSAFLFL